MGIALPQLAPASEDRVSGAQVIDGSLKFDLNKSTHLFKTFSTIGSSSRFTWSYWIKRTKFGHGGDQRVFSSSAGNGNPGFVNWFTSNDVLEARHYNGSAWDIVFQPTTKFRDTGWYHIVCTIDVTESANADRVKIYVNGTRETLFNTTTYGPARYEPLVFNGSNKSAIGAGTASGNQPLDAHLSNYYAIDGFALGPESFGYTDPLTGVWRPKKFSGELNPPFSDNWEGDTTGTGFNANTNKQNAFDGNPDTQAATGQNGTMSFTPTPAITGISKVRIKARRDAGADVPANFTLNGTTIGDLWTAGNVATVEITSLGGNPISQLTNLTWKGNTNNNEWFGVYMIEVYSNGAYHTLRQGGNGFYLPMDGDSPIGLDQSGKGNDFTPVNFGGSLTLDKATGARPILNTGSGGRVARPGVFGSEAGAYYATTSASNSGGKYVFEDQGTQPTFSFIRGATYTFDYSASSSHPLRFATAADAAGSTEYTDGTSISGNVIKFTVPHNAPDTLYYYCNVHNGMGNSISVTTDETKADPYAWKCVLALPLVGNDDDQSKNINATQSAVKATTSNGNASATSATSNFYGGSFNFDGNGDYVSSPYNSDFDFSNGEFTVEAWFNSTQTGGYPGGINRWQNANTQCWDLRVSTTDKSDKAVFVYNDGSVKFLESGRNVNDGNWHHLAVTRSGNTLNFFVDGVKTVSDSYSGTINQGQNTELRIGYNDTNYYNGKMQDVRIYKGVAKYTSDFVVPATSPDILPDSPSSTAVKPKLTKITDGAVSFDGTNDYLSVPDSDDFDLAGNDWTIEAFVYHSSTDYASYEGIVAQWVSGSGTDRTWTLETVGSGATSDLEFYYVDTSNNLVGPVQGGTLSKNRWHHVAACRSGNTIRMFIDGVMHGSGTSINVNIKNSTDPLWIGRVVSGYWNGQISNVRVVKGTALYTSNFTPPTRTLTNVTNTKLLCCQSSTSATDGAVKPGNITANGDASVTNFNPFNTDIDAIRGQEGNYCTWNPLRNGAILSNGNLDVTTSNNPRNTFATMGVSSGKWFWEVTINSIANTHYPVIGVNTDLSQEYDQQSGGAGDPDGYMMLASGPTFNNDDTEQYGPNSSPGDVIGVALDMDAGTISFHHNGKDLGVALSGITGTAVPAVVTWTGSSCSANFGQKPFKFPPPDGFQLLTSSAARPDATDTTPTITRPGDFVGVTTYIGNNTNPRNLDFGHPADLVWIKKRNATENNNISDSVRGPNNWISSDTTNAANTSGGPVLGFNDDGVTVDNNGYVNGNNDKYVAWSWRAGGKDGSNAFNIDDVGYANASDVNMSVGSLNSSAYDTSDVWSDDLSSPNGAYSGSSVTSAFNGNLTNGFEAGNPSNNYSTIRFQPASPITVNTQIRIHVFDLNDSNVTYQWRVNDGSWNNMPGTSSPYRRWQDLSFTGSLTSFEYRSNTSITYKPTLYAVEIDGKLLIDTGTDLSGLTQYPSIAATGCSVGTKQGFSIIQYTGVDNGTARTVPHGLTQKPDFMIVKGITDNSRSWIIYHSALGATKYFQFDNTPAGTNAGPWNNTEPTSTFFTLGTSYNNVNVSGGKSYISYHWHDVPGLQKFGSYKCNGDGSGGGSEDGPFVELGFKPAMILFRGNYNSDWTWIDNERCAINYNDVALRANYHYGEIGNARGGVGSSSQPENYAVDFLSNGFKIRASGGSLNSGTNIVTYAAWAEAPTFNLYGAQSNAK